jgi:hypothetical protein
MMTRTRITQRYTRVKFTLFRCISADLFFPAAAASRRHGSNLGTTIKYLLKTSSGATGIGLSTTVKYLRRTSVAAVGLGTTLNFLSGGQRPGETINYL